jgi:hypothetical protein
MRLWQGRFTTPCIYVHLSAKAFMMLIWDGFCGTGIVFCTASGFHCRLATWASDVYTGIYSSLVAKIPQFEALLVLIIVREGMRAAELGR